MPQIIPDRETYVHIEAQRQKARDNLGEITDKVKQALTDDGIRTPVFLMVPSSPSSIVLIGTQNDVDDDLWERISHVVQEVVGSVMAFEGTQTHELSCSEIRPDSPEENSVGHDE